MNGNISESLKRQRELILEESSAQALDRHTSLLEIAIISLYNRLANRPGSEAFRAGGAIVAVGSFGRGISSPTQAIPILCLQADDLSIKDSWIDEIAGPLIEAGWLVEALQGSVKTIMDQVRSNYGFFLKLMDMRYISGNRNIADQLDREIENHILENRESLFSSLRESIAARKQLLENARDWLEPDLEQNPGGLYEIQAIRAGCRIESRTRNLEDAIFLGYLTRQEVDFLQTAEKAFCTVPYASASHIGPGRQHTPFRRSGDACPQAGICRKIGFSSGRNLHAACSPVVSRSCRGFEGILGKTR